MNSSPYFFASILDEHARRQEHIEIIKDGERMLLVGKVPEHLLELAPLVDEPKRGAKWMEPAPVRPMPESDWTVIDWLVIAMFVGFFVALVAGWFE